MTYTAKLVLPTDTQPVITGPGDFILTASKSYVGAAIRFGQRIRFRDPSYSSWDGYNHAAGCVDGSGNLIEMLSGGATASNLEKYADKVFWHVKCPDPAKAQVAVSYWQWCLGAHGTTGQYQIGPNVKYNWFAAASDGFTCLTGSKIQFGSRGRLICSGMVAAGYCYAGMPGVMEWIADPSHVFPCELGQRYASDGIV